MMTPRVMKKMGISFRGLSSGELPALASAPFEVDANHGAHGARRVTPFIGLGVVFAKGSSLLRQRRVPASRSREPLFWKWTRPSAMWFRDVGRFFS